MTASPGANGEGVAGGAAHEGGDKRAAMHRDVVVVGASAGGVEALRTLVAGLPGDFPAAVVVVLHVPATGTSALPRILDRAGRLPVSAATEGVALRPGEVLVAAPDHHLVVFDGHVTLSRGPRENGHRPAIDVLFRSAARSLGPRVIGVVLSGTLDDGTAGLIAVRERHGIGVVQDPKDALYPAMPRNAISGAGPEHVLPVADIPTLLSRLVRQPLDPATDPPNTPLMSFETQIAAEPDLEPSTSDRPGEPSGFSCPECGGVLFRIQEGEVVRYRCRVGHAWSPASLAAQQTTALEGALWAALRSLEERAALNGDMAQRARDRGHPYSHQNFQAEADEALAAAALVRRLLQDLGRRPGADAPDADDEQPAGQPVAREETS